MKILVISLAGIGDTLFATPLLHELRANFPHAAIDVLVMWAGARDLLKGNPYVTTVHQQNLIQTGTLGSIAYLLRFRRADYDISINTHPQSRVQYRIAAFLAGARVRASHTYDNSGVLDRWLVNRSIPQDYSRHCIENNIDLLTLAGGSPRLPSHDYEIHFSADALTAADTFFSDRRLNTGPVLGIHVGSGGTKNLALRRWPVGHYVELVKRLRGSWPELRILLFGGPEEQEANETIVAQAGNDNILKPPTRNLLEAAAFVRKCNLFLSVDTAFMHLAAAAKVPNQVIIETPSWNRPIQPYNQPYNLVKNPALHGSNGNLQYYRYDGKGIQGTTDEIRRWMASVTVESVLQTIVKSAS